MSAITKSARIQTLKAWYYQQQVRGCQLDFSRRFIAREDYVTIPGDTWLMAVRVPVYTGEFYIDTGIAIKDYQMLKMVLEQIEGLEVVDDFLVWYRYIDQS